MTGERNNKQFFLYSEETINLIEFYLNKECYVFSAIF